MKKKFIYFVILISICLISICLFGVYYLTKGTPLVHHADSFYDLNKSDFSWDHLPLIDPVEAIRQGQSDPWRLELSDTIAIELPKSQEKEVLRIYGYTGVNELEKLAVKDGVIMAYSPYIDPQADAYIRSNFYFWYVMVPSQNITKGFHTEDEFRQYIRTLGIQDPDWQTPDEAYRKFSASGGCLEWIPGCK